ncbi:MAG: NAD(P)-dependent oxidoreductase [Bacteroidetes bacterium]|nr:MAG: NAD(P)-dependent oxidoreductase [Bacteroidota bacterium]
MEQSEAPRVLITGASGFIGSHLVAAALKRGWEVYAGVRATSSRKDLTDQRIKFFPVDFDKPGALKSDLEKFAKSTGGFHYVIHNAGITKPRDADEFYRGNALFTRNFAVALLETQPGLRKFVYMSSIAALGPGDPETFAPITESKPPEPITPYGRSKLKAEAMLAEIPGLPHISIRPSGVYGPGDEKIIGRLVPIFNRGIEVRIGPSDQRLSFVHVMDLATVTLDACLVDQLAGAFNISDGGDYSLVEFYKFIKEDLEVSTLAVRIPTGILVGYGYVLFKVLSAMGKQVLLSHYKMREVTAKNWVIDISHARQQLNYRPVYDLKSGVAQTLKSRE